MTYVGWYRPSGRRVWEAVVERPTESQAWRALLAHKKPGVAACEKMVLKKGEKP